MTEPSGEIARACEIGLPPSTRASPRAPNQSVQAFMTWSCSSLVAGIGPPPWNVSRKFAMSIDLHDRAALRVVAIQGESEPSSRFHPDDERPARNRQRRAVPAKR